MKKRGNDGNLEIDHDDRQPEPTRILLPTENGCGCMVLLVCRVDRLPILMNENRKLLFGLLHVFQ